MLLPNSQTSPYTMKQFYWRGQLCSCLCGCLEKMEGNYEGKSAFQRLPRLIFLLALFLLYFLSSLFLSNYSFSIFLSLRPSLISLPSPLLYFLLLPMTSSFLIFTATTSVVLICPQSSPAVPPIGGPPSFTFYVVHGVAEWQPILGQWPLQTAAAALVPTGHTKVYSS